MVDEATARVYTAIARKTLAPFKDEPGYEDIFGEALYELSVCLSNLSEEARLHAHRLIPQVVRQAAFHWLRSPLNWCRRTNRGGKPEPRRIAWQDLEPGEDGEVRDVSIKDWRAVTPDFAPELIHRLWTEQVWAEVWPLLPPEERSTAWGYLVDGKSLAELSREEGSHKIKAMRRFDKTRNRARLQYGLPPDGIDSRAHAKRRKKTR